MKIRFLQVLAAVAAVLFVSQPAAAGECDTRDALFRAAEESGVRLNYEQTVTASSEHVSFAGTSIAGFEQVSASQLRDGADAGFIYLDAPRSGIPAGFYRLHAQAPEPRLGTHKGTVNLVSREGKVVAQVPASMETWSMEVPRPLPFERTLMDTHVRNEPSTGGGSEARIKIIITIHCPNGTTITIIFDL